jgi:hypothetical protein
VSHKAKCVKNDVGEVNFEKTAHQFDVSLIGGFGAPFYRTYYTGIELDLFRRFYAKTSYNGEVGIIHSNHFGLNMDVRFGYLLPRHGAMIFVTAGFAKILGKMSFDADPQRGHVNNPDSSFGSSYPTFGFGAERKINHLWNIRGDFRISITSKDDNKSLKANSSSHWKYEAKPSRMAVRISITRNI